jgi:hypothetical protein
LSQAELRKISAGAHDGGVVDRPVFSEAVDTTLVHQLQHAQERDGDVKIIAQAGTLQGIVHGVVEATMVGLDDPVHPVGRDLLLCQVGHTTQKEGKTAHTKLPALDQAERQARSIPDVARRFRRRLRAVTGLVPLV